MLSCDAFILPCSWEMVQRALEHERIKIELQSIRRQCEVVKNLLADATAEKEIIYEVCSLHPAYEIISPVVLRFRLLMMNSNPCLMTLTCLTMKHGLLYLPIFNKQNR